MQFFLKILNETRSRSILKANGRSGFLYIFKWDGVRRAYTYYPKSQHEVDDLFGTMGRSTSYIFAPVDVPQAKPAEVQDAPAVPAQADPLPSVPVPEPIRLVTPDLVEMALHRGLIATDGEAYETVERVIGAYDKGVADTIAATPARRKAKRKRKTKGDAPPAE